MENQMMMIIILVIVGIVLAVTNNVTHALLVGALGAIFYMMLNLSDSAEGACCGKEGACCGKEGACCGKEGACNTREGACGDEPYSDSFYPEILNRPSSQYFDNESADCCDLRYVGGYPITDCTGSNQCKTQCYCDTANSIERNALYNAYPNGEIPNASDNIEAQMVTIETREDRPRHTSMPYAQWSENVGYDACYKYKCNDKNNCDLYNARSVDEKNASYVRMHSRNTQPIEGAIINNAADRMKKAFGNTCEEDEHRQWWGEDEY
jgi:hypothetical protein